MTIKCLMSTTYQESVIVYCQLVNSQIRDMLLYSIHSTALSLTKGTLEKSSLEENVTHIIASIVFNLLA
jgi:hypothetical protein